MLATKSKQDADGSDASSRSKPQWFQRLRFQMGSTVPMDPVAWQKR
jgi:hypothetical protein